MEVSPSRGGLRKRTLERACEELGRPVQRLASGAGHDAGPMSRYLPTGMIFMDAAFLPDTLDEAVGRQKIIPRF